VTSSSSPPSSSTAPPPAVAPFCAAPLPGFAQQPRPYASTPLPPGPPIRFRGDDDGFAVDEVPLYLPAGDGDHLYLHIEKRGTSTPEVWKRLRAVFGVKEIEIGTAGMKDARGVTRQWLSVPARLVEPRVVDDKAGVEADLGVVILEAKRHRNKLRTGHLRGNRFTCRLDDVSAADVAALTARAALLAQTGIPNWFGAQRFGHDDRALREAERWLPRMRRATTKREQFWVSAVQSVLFNDWLALRVDEGSWAGVVCGDVCEKRMTDARGGPLFVCDDVATDAPRAARGEISPTGPLYGQQMRTAASDALTRESRSLERLGVDRDALLAHPAFSTGTRRSARLVVEDVVVSAAARDVVADGGGSVVVSFVLPPGAYASVFLTELVGPRFVDLAFAPRETGPDVAADVATGSAED
jgi:tRNA pseudouridine13 synthase